MPSQLDRLRVALAGQYDVERELGAGGMAIVYLADDLRHKRKVAVKVLRPELAAVVGGDRFSHEIEVTAGLQHPHILPLFASGETDGLVYYIMPFVEGDSLRDRLQREEPLSFAEVTTILREVADALAYAHSRGVLHRDIKPDNIMLSGGHATVMDFGVARAVSSATNEAALTTAGLAIGTPAYMAPEQAAADPEIDHRADIYALGILGYELLTGTTPFEGRAPHQILAAQMTEAPELVVDRRPDIPPGLAGVVMKALQKDVEDRWATANEIVTRLAPGDQGNEPPTPRTTTNRRLGRVLAAVVGVTALVVVGLVMFGPSEDGGSALSDNSIAVFPFRVGGGPEVEYLRDGMATWLGRGLDGAGELRSVDPHAVVAAVRGHDLDALTPERLSAIAADLGAGSYVMGEVSQAGQQIRIDAAFYEGARQGDPMHATAMGDLDDALQMADDIASQLLALRAAPTSRVAFDAGATTQSLPAFKSFLEGEGHFRGGEYENAVEAFQRAIAADSEFALAQYRLSIAAEYSNRSTLAAEAVSAARRNMDRLSEHDSMLLEAFVLARDGDDDRAAQLLRGIVARWPQDVEAWFQLGEIDFHYGPLRGRPMANSRAAFERALRLDPDHSQSIEHVQRIAARLGETSVVDSLGRRIMELLPETRRGLMPQVFRAVARRDSAELVEILTVYRSFPDLNLPNAPFGLMVWTDHFASVEPFLAVITEADRSPEVRAVGHVYRAYVLAAQGHLSAARSELAAAAAFDPSLGITQRAFQEIGPLRMGSAAALEALRTAIEEWDADQVLPSALAGGVFNIHDGLYPYIRLHALGITNARLERRDEAATAEAALRRAASDEQSGVVEAMALSVSAHIALARGDTVGALAALERQPPFVFYQAAMFSPVRGRSNDRFLRGVLLEALGRTDEAVRWYNSFEDFSPHDIVLIAPANLALGRIAEAAGRVDDARRHYERVVFLWLDADPELQPMVDEAIAALRRIG